MLDEQAFIATIRAHPFEWGPRLVYADWLEEQGESPRAELMRMLNRLYTSPPTDPEAKQALIRQICGMSVHGPLHAEPFFLNSIGTLMRRVEAGTFWMGGGGDEPGTTQVKIPNDYYLGVFEVTQSEWRSVMGHRNNPSYLTGDARPVETVSWYDAKKFIEKLNLILKENGYLYRLPKEAEWEYACREATTSEEDSRFDFYLDTPSNEISLSDANFNGNLHADEGVRSLELKITSNVGSYRANRLGLYDMHGNVWEWCEDLYPKDSTVRMERGGSCRAIGIVCSAAYRSSDAPEAKNSNRGFRLAATPLHQTS